MIDVGAITFVQTLFLQHITNVFDVITGYSLDLLYIFAAFELVIFGLLWAFGENAWERFFFKVLKIGLIFFIIQNYSYLVSVIVQSLAQVGGILANTHAIEHIIFNPARLWQFGYDQGLMLLKFAAVSNNMGLSMIMVTLGIGILMIFGLFGIQIILQVVGFYLVSLAGLIFLPLSVFNPAEGMFDSTVRSVLKSGVRVMVLIMVVGLAVTVWGSLHLNQNVSHVLPKNYNITQSLGLFFTSLLFLYLAIKLPQMASEVVGSIVMRIGSGKTATPIVNVTQTTSTTAQTAGNIQSVQAATTIQPAQTQSGFQTASASAMQSANVLSPQSATTGSSTAGVLHGKNEKSDLARASLLSKSISDTTLKKLENTLVKVFKETGKANKE